MTEQQAKTWILNRQNIYFLIKGSKLSIKKIIRLFLFGIHNKTLMFLLTFFSFRFIPRTRTSWTQCSFLKMWYKKVGSSRHQDFISVFSLLRSDRLHILFFANTVPWTLHNQLRNLLMHTVKRQEKCIFFF